MCPSPSSVTGYSPKEFIPGLTAGDKLVWCNLRIDGHEQCRKYLVKFPYGVTPTCDLGNNSKCQEPQSN